MTAHSHIVRCLDKNDRDCINVGPLLEHNVPHMGVSFVDICSKVIAHEEFRDTSQLGKRTGDIVTF